MGATVAIDARTRDLGELQSELGILGRRLIIRVDVPSFQQHLGGFP